MGISGMFRRGGRAGLPLLFLAAAIGLAGTLPARAQEGDARASAARLVVADAHAHTLTVLDAASGERIATFGTPGRIGNVVRSSSGRWVFATHTDANKVTVLDSGLRRLDHGDHLDLEIGVPYVRATVHPGRKPIDFWSGNGMATVHNDDEGTLAVFDEARLEESTDLLRIKGAGTGHSNAVVLEDTVLLSLASEEWITAYGLTDGGVRQTFEGCPGTHGWTTRGQTFAAVAQTKVESEPTFENPAIGSHREQPRK